MSIQPWFVKILKDHQRVAVTGGPKTGKTTLCEGVKDRAVVHTDTWMHLDWSAASQIVADIVNVGAPALVVEGVAVPRALRKGMKVDAVVYIDGSHVPLTEGQRAMTKAVWTVLSEWRQTNPDVPVYFVSTAPGKISYG